MRGTIKIDNNKIRWSLSVLLAVLLLFSTYHTIFSLAAFLICGLMIFFCNREFILLQMFFIMPMANIFKMSPGSQSFFTILLLAYVALHLVLPRNATAIIAIFAFYVVIMELVVGQFNLFRTIKLICNVLFLSSILNSKVKIHHKEVFLSYIIGNIVASVWGMMDSSFFKIESYVGVEEYKEVELDEMVTRFTGLYNDPNYYAVGLIVSLCLIVVLFHREEIKTWVALLFTVPIIYFLIQTYSKSAIVMLVFVLLFLMYSLIMKKKVITVIALSSLVVAVVILAFSGQIPALRVVVERFMVSDTMQGVDVNKLTTGRSDIWVMYIEYLINNFDVLLFGQGIGAGYYNKAPHNTYIDFVYFLGVTGTFLLLFSFIAISKQSRHVRIKRNPLNYSVILCVVIMYFFLSELFFFDIPFHLFVAFSVLNISDKEKRGLK